MSMRPISEAKNPDLRASVAAMQSAARLAREIAGRVEQDMEYPGQVQVTVVRESRAVEVAR